MSIDNELTNIKQVLCGDCPVEDKLKMLYKLKDCFESAYDELFPGKTIYKRGDFRVKAYINGIKKDKLNVNLCILGNDNVITVDVEHKVGMGDGEIEIIEE